MFSCVVLQFIYLLCFSNKKEKKKGPYCLQLVSARTEVSLPCIGCDWVASVHVQADFIACYRYNVYGSWLNTGSVLLILLDYC